MLRLYNTLTLPLRLALPLWGLVRARSPEARAEWAERRARRLPSAEPGGVWIHGASVGEARLVDVLTRGLRKVRPDLPLYVSAQTRTGRSQLPGPPRADAAFFLPFDFPGYPGRVLRHLRPGLLALVETELWPNLVVEADADGVPVAVVNGRLSEERMTRYRRLRGLYGPLLRRLTRVGARAEADAARFIELGVDAGRVEVTGNVKYDLPVPAEGGAKIRSRLRLADARPVFVAGSTGDGEDPQVLEAYGKARARYPDLLLVLAPRHLERVEQVEALVRSEGLRLVRLSEASDHGVGPEPDVLLVDTLGQLAGLYRLASVAFVGGSLVPIGGHNLLEPAAVGVPVLFGPHVQHFAEPAAALREARAGVQVRDADDLGVHLVDLLENPERRRRMGGRALRVVESNRGAIARSVDLLLDTLGR